MQHQPAQRLDGFGTTIFAEMTALAQRTGAINLGQGFPDVDGPPAIVEAAARALRAGPNQYAPARGVPELRRAIADHQRRFHGIELDPDRQVQVTVGATEAIAAAILGLCDPGDAVVTFEPYYDSYAACIAMAGGVRRPVALRPPGFGLDVAALRAAADGARILLLNSPHNPTGKVFDRGELEQIAAVCREHDLIAICDEVYEHLAFDGEHLPLATLAGMAERTLTISSAGKTFSLTGWKVGWATGPAALVDAVAAAKQFLTFSGHGPLQLAVAEALALPDDYFAGLARELAGKRDRLCAGLAAAGLDVLRPAGTYFATVDVRSVGARDGREFCRQLPEQAGVVGVPTVVFYDDEEVGRPLVRFAFCKRDEVLDEAIERLARWRDGQPYGVHASNV
ncbi:pyridoxal phosphate-dependent aminotransferase [Patulibacter defluvii]|uniref:pyridoxal phosphate-dependent aminotransferase n=1 Tax=Patulibacter defluvii TaxID=3095358 RepID=UPI002A75916F|nr:pyridoxal phosphate-dependent aminotransferase [Patulibacter sp. DM4]